MKFMDPKTGKQLTGKKAFNAALHSILITHKATRRGHREYGSNILNYIDESLDDSLVYSVDAENVQLLRLYLPELEYINTEISSIDQLKGILNLVINGSIDQSEFTSEVLTVGK